jgi:hypothetical protein
MTEPASTGAFHFFQGQTPPELLGVQGIVPLQGKPGKYRIALPTVRDGECTLLVECSARDFPFESYCRFVRHPGENHPYTFSSMQFHKNGPGIRLGPWPGWRGIPELPAVSASCEGIETKMQATFWGDEIDRGILRLVGVVAAGPERDVIITSTDPKLIPTRVAIYHTHRLTARPLPARLLPELIEVHPRLLIRQEQLPLLRARAGTTHQKPWSKLLAIRENRHLPFEKTSESKCVAGPERLAGEDRVLIFALIALLTEQEPDVRLALDAFAAYITETKQPGFEPLHIDTQSGEVLFTLAVGYDWLFRWMSVSERAAAWREIERVAAVCTSFLGPERRDYGQAHFLGCGLGLLAYALLCPARPSDSGGRIADLRGALECALTLLSDDGSYPHGINLWIYEFGFLLRWIELFRGCAGEDVWPSMGHALKQASAFRAATLSSDAMKGITFGDPQYRVGGDSWIHFLIASRTGFGPAQWVGERLLDLPHEGVDFRNIPARRRVYEFLFYAPDVIATPPGGGVYTYADIGQVTARSKGTLFTLRSGPPLGRKRYAKGEYGAYGHSDPGNGSFLIERNGKLVASGPGPVYRRDTSLHNVMTVDRKGQIGDSTVWLPDFLPPEVMPPTLQVDSQSLTASLTADLTKAYLPHLGVRRCTRAVYADPARLVAGVDTIHCGESRTIEWNVHSHFPFHCASDEEPFVFDLEGDVRLIIWAPTNASWLTGVSEFVPAYPNDGTRDYRCVVSTVADDARFIWLYLLAGQSVPVLRKEDPVTFTAESEDGDRFFFDGTWLSWRGKR